MLTSDVQEKIAQLTKHYGGEWAFNHSRRLIQLVMDIAEKEYRQDIIWLAVYLHDWGAYAPWSQPGADHASQSSLAAAQFLREQGFEHDIIKPVLECIAFHHQAGTDRSYEAILLRDADALDFLGVIGLLRDFAKQARDLQKGYENITARKEKLIQIVTLPKSKAIAAERYQIMNNFLGEFNKETFGYF